MKVMISGVAGFIGSNLADRLIAQGHEVSGIDNFETGREENLNSKIHFLEADISGRADVIESFFNAIEPDVVVHAAASYKDPNNWRRDIETNILGTERIVRCCQSTGVKRVIYFQSSLCYGDPGDPKRPILITDPINPKLCSYAISKATAEQIIRMSGLDYISFRLANAYGERNLSGPLPTFFKMIKEGKQCTVTDTRRDFIYIEDLCNVVIKAIDGMGKYGCYHVSTGGDYEIIEMYGCVRDHMILENLASDIPEVNRIKRGADDVATLLLDPSYTEMMFDGWSPKTDLYTGIGRAIKWYAENGVEKAFTHLRIESEVK